MKTQKTKKITLKKLTIARITTKKLNSINGGSSNPDTSGSINQGQTLLCPTNGPLNSCAPGNMHCY